MPQIDQIAEIYASQLFWLVVVFALLYFGIGKAMVPKIQRTVDDRQARISGDLAAAEAARAEADAAEAAYAARLNESRATAQAELAAAKAKATAEAEARVKAADAAVHIKSAEAEARLAHALGEASESIEQIATEAAREIAERVAALSVSPDEAARAVRAAAA